MPSSDSEDFESADEGSQDTKSDRKERKKRLSSSNYSESAQGSDHETKHATPQKMTLPETKKIEKTADGWDDFDIDESETTKASSQEPTNVQHTVSKPNIQKSIQSNKSKDNSWDDFDDWGQEEVASNVKKEPTKLNEVKPDVRSNADHTTSGAEEKKAGGWGWGGWGVDSLLSSATAGISSLTTHVSQGISTVLETGIGVPEPEELARMSLQRKSEEQKSRSPSDDPTSSELKPDSKVEEVRANTADGQFQFGSLLSGVTKFVETTGTKVLAGGLDTLETIGKKTMEVLQDGDPGLAKKRAMLGLDSGDKPVLSQVLKEAKARADEEDMVREEKREAKQVHYETLFDDFEGLVHLEALEMLSKQVNMRIEERLRGVDADKRQEIKETLQQVSELCEMPDEEEEEDESTDATADAFHERLQESTQDLGVKLQFQPIVNLYSETLDWLTSTTEEFTEKIVYKRAVSSLAQHTAMSVELYHKCAEMLLVKARRSTADEADAMTQMTAVLKKHIGSLATHFTDKLNSLPGENKEQINTYITNVFLEADNSSSYVQNAFQLILPILQIGAV